MGDFVRVLVCIMKVVEMVDRVRERKREEEEAKAEAEAEANARERAEKYGGVTRFFMGAGKYLRGEF